MDHKNARDLLGAGDFGDTAITPSLRDDLEMVIEATGPLEDAAPEFQDAVARLRAATSLPRESMSEQAHRDSHKILSRASWAIQHLSGDLATLSLFLDNEMALNRKRYASLRS